MPAHRFRAPEAARSENHGPKIRRAVVQSLSDDKENCEACEAFSYKSVKRPGAGSRKHHDVPPPRTSVKIEWLRSHKAGRRRGIDAWSAAPPAPSAGGDRLKRLHSRNRPKGGTGRRPHPGVSTLTTRLKHRRQFQPYDNRTPRVCHGFADCSGVRPALQWGLLTKNAPPWSHPSESCRWETDRGSIRALLAG